MKNFQDFICYILSLTCRKKGSDRSVNQSAGEDFFF